MVKVLRRVEISDTAIYKTNKVNALLMRNIHAQKHILLELWELVKDLKKIYIVHNGSCINSRTIRSMLAG